MKAVCMCMHICVCVYISGRGFVRACMCEPLYNKLYACVFVMRVLEWNHFSMSNKVSIAQALCFKLYKTVDMIDYE